MYSFKFNLFYWVDYSALNLQRVNQWLSIGPKLENAGETAAIVALNTYWTYIRDPWITFAIKEDGENSLSKHPDEEDEAYLARLNGLRNSELGFPQLPDNPLVSGLASVGKKKVSAKGAKRAKINGGSLSSTLNNLTRKSSNVMNYLNRLKSKKMLPQMLNRSNIQRRLVSTVSKSRQLISRIKSASNRLSKSLSKSLPKSLSKRLRSRISRRR